jgi:hypothetical protein
VPEEFVNQTFDKLFKHLIEKSLIAIALYRLPGATDNRHPYCYSNPDMKTIITNKDRVFVLGREIPNDLIIDVKRNSGNNRAGTASTAEGGGNTRRVETRNRGRRAVSGNFIRTGGSSGEGGGGKERGNLGFGIVDFYGSKEFQMKELE